MSTSLAGKVFVVTGGGSGIGRATVQKLLNLSATVHALDITDMVTTFSSSPTSPNEVAPCKGHLFTYPKVDVAVRDQVRDAFDKMAGDTSGRAVWLDGLVNCAGLLRPSVCSTDVQGDQTFETLWKVNVMGAWHTTTEFYERLQNARLQQQQKDIDMHSLPAASTSPPPQLTTSISATTTTATTPTTASVVNVGSMASVRGIPGMAAYVASKHGLHGLTRCLAQELGPEGIRVNAVAPGGVNTPMMAGASREGQSDAAYRGAFKMISEPEEIADVIVYLLGQESSSVSGQLVEVNGGWP